MVTHSSILGKSHGERSRAGHSPHEHEELDTSYPHGVLLSMGSQRVGHD